MTAPIAPAPTDVRVNRTEQATREHGQRDWNGFRRAGTLDWLKSLRHLARRQHDHSGSLTQRPHSAPVAVFC